MSLTYFKACACGCGGEQTALAREYGVTPALIQMIVRGDHR